MNRQLRNVVTKIEMALRAQAKAERAMIAAQARVKRASDAVNRCDKAVPAARVEAATAEQDLRALLLAGIP